MTPQIGRALDDLFEYLLRKAVSPVQVFDQQHDLRNAATRPEQCLQQVARAQADQHAVEPCERALRRFEAEQIEQQAEFSWECSPSTVSPISSLRATSLSASPDRT